jgi:RNA polymerase sigma factor (sigma-70 family)
VDIIAQMPELDDHELLAEFASSNSETAFATLVSRYVNLVYSTAVRVTDNAHHAEEITQAVFIILARKAGSLSPRVVLSGWLYQVARFTAANFLKGENRRQRREQEAYMQSILNEPAPTVWKDIAPLLDEAMGRLGETDRNVVVLRYFENKSAAEVAAKLDLTEDAARKRANRALGKMRKFFAGRGVSLTGVILAAALSANSVKAAPVGLAKALSAAAITKGATASISTLTLVKGALKLMAWNTMKPAIVFGSAILFAGGVVTVLESSLTAAGANDKPVELKINWQTGKKYTFHLALSQSNLLSTPAQGQLPGVNLHLAEDFSVVPLKKLANDGCQAELRFEKAALNASQADSKILSFASSAITNDPITLVLKTIIGVPIRYEMDGDSKAQKFEGLSELQHRAMANANAQISPEAQPVLQFMLDDYTFKRFGSLGDTLPNGSLKLGEHSQVTENIGTPVGFPVMDMDYTFKGWEERDGKQCARVGIEGTVSEGQSTAQKGTMSGDVWFDPSLGMIVDVNLMQDFTTKVESGRQTMDAHMIQKVHLNLADVTGANR